LRIGGAVFVGVALIGGALFFGHYSTAENTDIGVVAVEGGTREYQETKDTDDDGMRDWEEELKGTDPLVPNRPPTKEEIATAFGTPSTTELSQTVTARFTRTFFEKYFNKGFGTAGVEEAARTALIDGSIDSVVAEVSDDFYTLADIKTSPNTSINDLRDYGNALGTIFESHTVANENEVFIFKRALDTGSEEELAKLDPIVTAYADMIEEVRATAPPSVTAKEHLDILNTLVAVHNDIVAMRNGFVDPLPALVRVKRYQEDATALFYAIDNMRTAFENGGVAFAQGEPGMFFFSLKP
jgi:hypothetical protein